MAHEPDSVREFLLPRVHREAAMKVSDILAAKGGKAGGDVTYTLNPRTVP